MVIVASTIEANCIQQLDLPGKIVSSNTLCLFFQKVVQISYIGPVMLSIVIVQSQSAHHWF